MANAPPWRSRELRSWGGRAPEVFFFTPREHHHPYFFCETSRVKGMGDGVNLAPNSAKNLGRAAPSVAAPRGSTIKKKHCNPQLSNPMLKRHLNQTVYHLITIFRPWPARVFSTSERLATPDDPPSILANLEPHRSPIGSTSSISQFASSPGGP